MRDENAGKLSKEERMRRERAKPVPREPKRRPWEPSKRRKP